MTTLPGRRLDPDARAGLRLTLLAVAVLAGAALVLPIAVLVRDQWAPLARLDTGVDRAAHSAVVAHSWLLYGAKALTQLGAPTLVQVAGVVIALMLLRAQRRRSALFLAVCIAGGYLLSTTGKLAVGRARPSFPDPVAHANGASFPSGHATGAATFWLALAVVVLPHLARRRRRPLLVLALLVGVVVAATRVLLGVHYPTDVVAGLLLGWGWVAACTAVFSAWRADEGRPAQPLEEGVDPEPVR